MSGIVVQVVQAWMPETSATQIMLGLALGIVASAVYLVWHRNFVRVWLTLHQASPLDAGSPHAALLPRFRAVLERAGARLPVHPTVHRYGAPGGQVVNAAALCSLNVRAVAMSDTLLANLDADEATAIFAHEIAHHEHYTDALLRKRRVAGIVLAVCLAALPALHLATGGRYTLAIDGLFLVAILIFVARGQQGHRAHETECDLRAVDLSGDADAVIRGLTKIHALSLVPRRFSQEFERAATHPSLARRIQAIRARTAVIEPARDEPIVVATTTPGAYVALDDARSYWFEGAPTDAPLDIGVLREQATSYRALAYRELGELRLVAERPRTLRAADLAGRSWSVGIRDEDVARVLAALDRVDVKLGTPAVEPKASGVATARTIAALVLIATMLAGIWGTTTFVTFIALLVPSVASLAAMAAMAMGAAVLSLASGASGMPYELAALAIVIGAALWSAFIAWKWHRAARDGGSREIATRQTVLWTRALFAVLAIGVAVSLLGLAFGGLSSPAALLGDPQTASAAIAVLGLGSALLVARGRAWRRTGVCLVALAAVGVAAGTIGERWADIVERDRVDLGPTLARGDRADRARCARGGDVAGRDALPHAPLDGGRGRVGRDIHQADRDGEHSAARSGANVHGARRGAPERARAARARARRRRQPRAPARAAGRGQRDARGVAPRAARAGGRAPAARRARYAMDPARPTDRGGAASSRDVQRRDRRHRCATGLGAGGHAAGPGGVLVPGRRDAGGRRVAEHPRCAVPTVADRELHRGAPRRRTHLDTVAPGTRRQPRGEEPAGLSDLRGLDGGRCRRLRGTGAARAAGVAHRARHVRRSRRALAPVRPRDGESGRKRWSLHRTTAARSPSSMRRGGAGYARRFRRGTTRTCARSARRTMRCWRCSVRRRGCSSRCTAWRRVRRAVGARRGSAPATKR